MAVEGACGNAGCATQRCLEEEMKRIPARFLTEKVRYKLSEILDYPKDVPDRDYRAFADRHNITPQKLLHLESQKHPLKTTSSIKMILEYLEERDGTSFTVFSVFNTLRAMGCEGEQVILDAMPKIRQMYNGGCREGQENAESLSAAALSVNGSGPGSFQCNYVSNVEGPHFYNNLGDGYPSSHQQTPRLANKPPVPGENSYYDIRSDDAQSSVKKSQPVSRPNAPDPTLHPAVRMNITLQPQESSYLSANPGSEQGVAEASASDFPPSYDESQRDYRGHNATEMELLKPPLNEAENYSTQQTQPRNQRPAAPSRPVSYPQNQPASLQRQTQQGRPVSEINYCSHSGACSCPSVNGFFLAESALEWEAESSLHPPSFIPPSLPPGSSQHDASMGPEAELNPRHHQEYHDTHVKQPLDQQGTDVIRVSQSLPYTPNNKVKHNRPYQSLPDQNQDFWRHCASGSNYFVFILAADPERKSELRVQVSAVSERLKEKKIPHVIVTSLSLRPTVELPPHIKTDLPDLILPASHQSDWNSRQKSSIVTFVQFALKKAGNVLILVSPGYFRYADPYSEGAEETSNTVQRLIRKCHSKLKEEFFHTCTRSKTLRIWPVLLCDMNAVRAHIPSFLSDSMFYTYPSRTDDFVLLLKITMSDSACQRISNLRIQSG